MVNYEQIVNFEIMSPVFFFEIFYYQFYILLIFLQQVINPAIFLCFFSVSVGKNEHRFDLQSRLPAASALDEHKRRRRSKPVLNKPQPLRFYAAAAHGTQKLGKSLAPVDNAEAAPGFQQKCRGSA